MLAEPGANMSSGFIDMADITACTCKCLMSAGGFFFSFEGGKLCCKKITSGRTNLCCVVAWGNHAFLKPIVVFVSCWLGKHTFCKSITIIIVVSFEEPINKLGQILS